MASDQTNQLRRVGENLYANHQGTYFAWISVTGKQIKRSLKTTDKALARRRLGELREKADRLHGAKHRQVMKNKNNPTPTPSKLSVLRQLCNLIPNHLVPKIARDTGVDARARTFSPWSHVVTLIFGQISHSLGLNNVCDALGLHRGPLSALRGATPPSRNSLSHANRNRDAAMAERLFWAMLDHLQNLSPGFGRGRRGRGQTRRFRRAIHIVDSTTIATNNLEWSAGSVADLYRSRWSIEVFFKQIKQTLQLSDFLGHSANAIRWQVWTALLVYLLLRYQAFVSDWAHSFNRLFTLIRSVLWRKLDLRALLERYGTAGGSFRMLGMPQEAYFPGF